MRLYRLMTKFLFVLTLAFNCYADDVIVDFTDNSVPVLNEELRKIKKESWKDTLKKAYPVGCIYISTVSTDPAELFGFGTWAAFGAGRVLVGINTGDADFDTVEETGGAKTHTLTVAEMPAHAHKARHFEPGDVTTSRGYHTDVNGDHYDTTYEETVGGGNAHNNVQPYIVVYMFERTA